MRNLALLLVACLACQESARAQPEQPEAPADGEWIKERRGTAELVSEPVFGGNVMLYRAGRAGAPAVVLIHGLGQNGARDWAPVIPALADRFDLYLLDLPGFGASDKGNHLYSPANFGRVIEAVIGARAGRPFALVGHSMGGSVSLGYAAAYPQRVERLVLVDMAGVLHRYVYAEFLSRLGAQLATGVYPQDAPWFSSLVRTILTRVDALPLGGDLVLGVPALRQRMLRGDPNAIAAYALVEHDFSRALREIRVPTLVIWGSEDRIAPLRTGEMAAAVIPGARLAVIAGSGHTPMLESTARFNPLLVAELQGTLSLPAFALGRGELRDARSGSCEGRSGERFSGDYAELRIERCSNVQISNARIGSLAVTNSSVRITNSQIRDGLDARHSRLELTAGVVRGAEGGPALALTDSSVDAAGTRFEAAGAVFENRGKTPLSLALSVAEVVRGDASRYLHEVLPLAPYSSWPGPK